MQMIIALVKRDNLARHARATDVVANQVAERCLECLITEKQPLVYDTYCVKSHY